MLAAHGVNTLRVPLEQLNTDQTGNPEKPLRQVMEWVAESPWADRVLGWEPLNEWDSNWTLNAESDAEPGRVGEMRRRGVFLHALQQLVHEQDPGALVFDSMARLDPRGPLARAVFYDRSVDVMAPHF